MNQLQKEQITALRAGGNSYSKIASELGISINTVKSYCKRNLIESKAALTPVQPESADRCPQCNAILEQSSGHRQKRFCSSRCRLARWKAHPEQMTQRKVVSVLCQHCGDVFQQYGGRTRKYCSRDCYIAHRYGSNDDVHGKR